MDREQWLAKLPAKLPAKLLWVGVAIYVAVLLLSPPELLLPGEPIWAVKIETLEEIVAESLNFFFVLPVLSAALKPLIGLSAPVVHPASEAFFNFAEAWIFMFLPLMLLDSRGQRLPKVAIWGGAMFLTNVFLIPYMALRLKESDVDSSQVTEKGRLARGFGLMGLVVGTVAIAWFTVARPEFGSIHDRALYLLHKLMSDRVTIAFLVDLCLFWVFQVWLMGAIAQQNDQQGDKRRSLRFVPFFGLAIWLLTKKPRQAH